MSDESWMNDATCRILQIPRSLFFQEIGRRPVVTDAAKRICSHCHVSEQCLDYAIDNNIQDGIWGGKTSVERKKERRLRIMLDNTA